MEAELTKTVNRIPQLETEKLFPTDPKPPRDAVDGPVDTVRGEPVVLPQP